MMDWFSKAFLKSSLVWLGVGVSLGALMAAVPPLAIYRTAHLHLNMLGFVSMMIFGVAYHVVPRFTGHPLFSVRLAAIHVWVANAGLALLVTGFLLMPTMGPRAVPVQAAGGVLSAAGAYLFIFNIWRTLNARLAPRRAQAGGTKLPTVASE